MQVGGDRRCRGSTRWREAEGDTSTKIWRNHGKLANDPGKSTEGTEQYKRLIHQRVAGKEEKWEGGLINKHQNGQLKPKHMHNPIKIKK